MLRTDNASRDGGGKDVERRDMELTELAASEPAQGEGLGPSLEAGEREAQRNATVPTILQGDEALADDAAAASQESREDTPNGNEDGSKSRRTTVPKHSAALTELYTISWLIFFSFWGTLARVGVEAITLYPNAPVSSRVLWANLGGSFVLGFLTEDRRLFREEWSIPNPDASPSAHVKVKRTIPLYIGLATGFCGCFTSFSSFIRDAFLALTNALESPSPRSPYHTDLAIPSRNGGFSFLALLAILIIHPAVSLAALKAGARAAVLLQPVTPVIPFRLARRFLDPLAVVLAFGCWMGVVLLSIFPPGNSIHWRFRATFALVFAPPGCLLRFYTSKHLNALNPTFPLGTFAVNIFGSMVLGMAWNLQHAPSVGASSHTSCSIMQGIMEGFCGCLTTVSTWVLELQGLRPKHGWSYGLASVGIGLAFMVVIMGSMAWTVGFARPTCG